MYKGIIFDSVQRDAFLSIAAREGLICEKGFTDGVFDKVTCHNPSSTLQQTVLEQFTIAGAVYIDPFIYKCMDGELIQNGIIMPYEKSEHNMEGFFTFDVDIVQRMMEEKGLFYSIDEIDKMFYELQEAIQEFVKLKNQYNLDYREIQIRRTLQLEPKADCHDVDIDSFIKLYDSLFNSFGPTALYCSPINIGLILSLCNDTNNFSLMYKSFTIIAPLLSIIFYDFSLIF